VVETTVSDGFKGEVNCGVKGMRGIKGRSKEDEEL